MIRLFVTVSDISAVMTAGYTVVRVYTDTSATGAFSTLSGTITLVASTDSYEYIDASGDEDTWYRTAYYGAVPGQGSLTTARKGGTSQAYATVAEFRAEVNKTATTDDLSIARLLDAAARLINTYCNRPDGFVANPTASIRYYPGSGASVQRINECVAVSAVSVKDSPSDDEDSYTAWTVGTIGTTTSADVFPASGDPSAPTYRTPYTMLITGPNGDYSVFTSGLYAGRTGFTRAPMGRGVPTVAVTATWGYALTPPADIKMANIMQAARWYKRLQSSMADALASLATGQLVFRQRIDPDIKLILQNGRYIIPEVGRLP